MFFPMSVACVLVAAYALITHPGNTTASRQPMLGAPVERLVQPSPSATGSLSTPSQNGAQARRVHDVSALLRPKRDYVGLAHEGTLGDFSVVESFARRSGALPNMVTIYQNFGDPFVASEVRRSYEHGALAIVRWEPYTVRLSKIAAGDQDDFLTTYAASVRRVGLPMVMTFAHEMNGRWYPWGGQNSTPRDFIRSWLRIREIFHAAGATNVIWAWTPNVISGAPGVRLEDWYPGDRYVDWIGLDGYFAADGPRTYSALFGPTMQEVQRFSKRPFLIVETGVERSPTRLTSLKSLFQGVAADSRMLGFVYFNQPGSRDWLIDGDQAALLAFGTYFKALDFGFRVS